MTDEAGNNHPKVIQPFNIVRWLGEPKQTRTLKGKQVRREEKLFVPEWGAFVPCAPYDDHFVYLNPDTSAGSPSYMCTCGSAAVVVNHESAARLFVCYIHASTGKHATSFVDIKDFPNIGGEVIKLK